MKVKRPPLIAWSIVWVVCVLPLVSSHFHIRCIGRYPDGQRKLTLDTESVSRWPNKAKRFALVIGVDDYQDSQISRLEGASNDATILANALIQYAGFPSDQVILLTSNQQIELQPTRANVLRRLANLRQVVPQDGLLFVSFAGHGMERDGRAYLLPMDAQVTGDIGLLEDSAISVESMRDRIRQTGVGQVLIVLDACRNNPMAGRGGSTNPLTDAFVRGFNFDLRNRDIGAFATLYATGVGQVAHEYKNKKQGYFTWALVEGLKGDAANERGEVTLSGLVRYLQDAVPKRTRLDFGADRPQRPWAEIQGYKADELVITIVRQASSSKVAATPGETEPAATELVFWETIKNSKNQDDFNAYLQQYPNGRFATLARIRASGSTGEKVSPGKPGQIVTSESLEVVKGDPISGLWEGTYTPGEFPFTLRLHLEGNKVDGEHTLEGVSSPVASGTWTGRELTFTVFHKRSRIRMTASLQAGKLVGKKYVDGSTNPLEWSATRRQ